MDPLLTQFKIFVALGLAAVFAALVLLLRTIYDLERRIGNLEARLTGSKKRPNDPKGG